MSCGEGPRVSILIPNFNNGRESSISGDHDFIDRLLDSLRQTLHDDPTPFELIVYDDGSTDDGLQTLRDWAGRTWPDGRPFLELIEEAHCGVLSKVANVLSRRARGDLLVRIDGDVTCLTRHWVTKLCNVFDDGPPRLGIVGPKQLRPDMTIHAFGDWILHPNGYCHIAGGLPRHAVRWPLEVDHVMGCFYCCRKSVWDELDGYDETYLRGQTVDFGLRARLQGWSCVAVPHIECIHAHDLRRTRNTTADSPEGVRMSIDLFEQKWGFSRIVPDLDAVRARYRGTPLLWNARWFAAGGAAEDESGNDGAAEDGTATPIESTEWSAYEEHPAVRAGVDMRVAVATQVAALTGTPRLTAVVRCGAGLVAHLLANKQFACVGIDRRRGHVALARRTTQDRDYAGPRPRFEHQASPGQLPLEDAEVDLLLIYYELEMHPNPLALLREVKRVLAPGGTLAILSQRHRPREDAPTDIEHRYRWPELMRQVQAAGFKKLTNADNDDPRRDMVLVARRSEPAAAPLESAPRRAGGNTDAARFGPIRKGQEPFARSTLRAVPANGSCPHGSAIIARPLTPG